MSSGGAFYSFPCSKTGSNEPITFGLFWIVPHGTFFPAAGKWLDRILLPASKGEFLNAGHPSADMPPLEGTRIQKADTGIQEIGAGYRKQTDGCRKQTDGHEQQRMKAGTKWSHAENGRPKASETESNFQGFASCFQRFRGRLSGLISLISPGAAGKSCCAFCIVPCGTFSRIFLFPAPAFCEKEGYFCFPFESFSKGYAPNEHFDEFCRFRSIYSPNCIKSRIFPPGKTQVCGGLPL